MKNFLVILCFISFSSSAQINITASTPWKFMRGDSVGGYPYPIYGAQAQLPEGNNPGARAEATRWRDAAGNFWQFGGKGRSSVDENVQYGEPLLNDLWKYDVSLNQWIFIKGDNLVNTRGVYGIKGVSSPDNKPGARKNAASWVDAAGNLWMFGGYGYYTGGQGYLNDLWRYNISTNEWTWMHGDNSKGVNIVRGRQGDPDPQNNPGQRQSSSTWVDAAGKLWLFGGDYGTPRFNDIWKYDPAINQWTWMRGQANLPYYGTQGVESNLNTPAIRSGCAAWKDNSGYFWFYGGIGVGGDHSDLWRYNPATNMFAWMKGDTVEEKKAVYGTRGVAAPSNNPGARGGCGFWKDNNGNFWLYGGNGSVGVHVYDYFNDLWKYDVSTNMWTWYKGDNSIVHYGVYGTKGVAATANKPGSRSTPATWTDNAGKLWMFAGFTYHPNRDSNALVSGYYNDLWKYDPVSDQWGWIKGDSILNVNGSYGEAGYPYNGSRTGIRTGSSPFRDDAGNLWLFGGGTGRFGYVYNDLWKYNASVGVWIWMKGSNVFFNNDAGSYGIKGVESVSNNPAARNDAASWKDASGRFWVFGGSGVGVGNDDSVDNQFNDLWRFNVTTNNWTWISGDNAFNVNGVYGSKGVASSSNKPGARHDAVTWTDASGNLWLFGGEGFAASGTRGKLNDLWKYTPSANQWTWIGGDSVKNIVSFYGTKGTASSTNKPGGRSEMVAYSDASGNFWLYGGDGYAATSTRGTLSDMWRYSPVTGAWTWMQGANTTGELPSWGTMGVSAASNTPGNRVESSAWTDASGNFWLFGGHAGTFYNDLWRYKPGTNEWVWVKGTNSPNDRGSHGVKGIAASSNNPISKEGAVAWVDIAGNFWMHGGCTNFRDYAGTDEFSQYNVATNEWTWINGSESFRSEGSYGDKGISSRDNEPPGRTEAVQWIDNSNNLYLFGGRAKRGTEIYPNDLWKYNTLTNQWAWIKGDSSVNAYATYGTIGVENINNTPGGGSLPGSWKDTTGNFWLYGGGSSGNATSGDLWKYNVSNNMWTCIKLGNYAGPTYGTQGVAAPSNYPGVRTEVTTWADSSGNLWLFGGNSFSSCNKYNDLWKFNIASKMWTWVAGDSMYNHAGYYGTKGVASVLTKPGSRSRSTGFYRNGQLYLFGGFKYGCNFEFKGDLWKYNIDSNRWTWIHGDTAVNSGNIVGTPGVPSRLNTPSARFSSVIWKDISGNFWLYGGYSYSSEVNGDLWKYYPASNEWAYIDGANLVYGKPNRPGGKNTANGWADKSGNLWLFGGRGYGTTGFGYMNDLWKIYTGTTYVFTGTGNYADTNQWVNHLAAPTTITPGMDVTIDHIIPGSCTNTGTITLQQNGILRVESGKTLTINQGGLNNFGYVEGPGNLPGTVLFTGTNPNLLSSSGGMSAPIQLSLNKKIFLSGNSNTSRVELAAGSKMTLGSFNLNMDTSSLVTTSTSFIVTNDTGKIIRTVGATPVTFNIGSDSSSYSPVTITNTGVADDFRVRVVPGAANNKTTSSTGNVNRTWYISDSGKATISTFKFEWTAAEEQAGFDRTNAYVSQAQACQPPPNCTDVYYDIAARSSATGTNPYSLTRTNIVKPTSFVIKSGPDISTFTGNGSWDDPYNWTIGIVPSKVIGMGRELIIDPPAGGQCIVTGDITIEKGGTLTVKPGKILKVNGRIIVNKL